MENMQWLYGSLRAAFDNPKSAAECWAKLLVNDRLSYTFSVITGTENMLAIGLEHRSEDLFESVDLLREFVVKTGGVLTGGVLALFDDGRLIHVGIDRDNDIVEIDADDILSLGTDDLIKVRDFVRGLK